jgi:flavin-dependent dehydrogenase
VLIGDAAGHNDPIIGDGLPIALRDARIVRDLVLDGARDARRSPRTAPSAPPTWNGRDSSPIESR